MAVAKKRDSSRTIAARHTAEATRRLLLDAGTRLFAQKGFDGVSVKELCKSAGVNISLISYHFGGKEGLYQACLEDFGQAKLAAAERLLVPPRTREELRVRLQVFMDGLIRSYLEDRELVKIIHRDIEFDLPRTQQVFRSRFMKVFDTLASFFRAAAENGVVRKNSDPGLYAHIFFSVLTQTVRMDKVSCKYYGRTIQDEKYRELLIEETLKVLLNGMVVGSEERGST